MFYGANIFALYRRASELVDNILRGAKAIFQLNSRLVGATRTSRGCQLQLSESLALKRSSLQNTAVIGEHSISPIAVHRTLFVSFC